MSETGSKKKLFIIIAVLVFAAVSLVGGFAVAPLVKEKIESGSVSSKASETYSELLADNNIPDEPFGFKNLKSASFAVTTGGDSFEIVELGYKKDTVIEMYDSLYYSVAGLTETELSEFDEAIRNRCEAVANENYCTYSVTNEGGIYKLVMHFFALNEPQNVNDLIMLGIITAFSDKQSDSVSFSDTETSFVKMGFVKR